MHGRLHGLPWGALAAATTAAAALLAVAVAFPRHPFASSFFLLALVALGGATCFIVDDPAAEVVASVPRTLRRRTARRAAAVTVPLTVGLVGTTLVELRHAAWPWAGVLLEMSGAVLVGFATAVWLRAHRPTPGEMAATVVSVGLLVFAFANPIRRWVTVFAVTPDDRWARTTALWLGVLLVAAVVVLRATRDPLDR